LRHYLPLAIFALLLTPAQAQQSRDFGSPTDARLMLERVISAMQTDQAKALQLFNEGAIGFREADLYPYCGGEDGIFTAHPELVGTSMRDLLDKRGNRLGQWLYDSAKAGEIAEVIYYWPRPGSTEILQKVALVTRIGDQVCAVGYYRPGHRGKEAIP
jgi:hypothetical protein